ncbi:MAG: hypothetical protein ACR2PL_10850 [Dehalococcoidia bacterium]
MSVHHSRKESLRILLIGATAMPFLLLFLFGPARASTAVRGPSRPSQPQAAALAATTQPSPGASTRSAEEQQCIDAVAGKSIYDSYPPEKRAGLQPMIDQCVQARRNTPPHPLLGSAPVPASPTPWADRLLSSDQAGQEPYGNARLISGWAGDRDGVHLLVYTGAFKSDPSQGTLYLRTESFDHHTYDGAGPFLIPVKVGAVHIVQASGDVFELQAENGTTFSFDVASRQYVPSSPQASPAP